MSPDDLPGNVVTSYSFIICYLFKLYYILQIYFIYFFIKSLMADASINISDKKLISLFTLP